VDLEMVFMPHLITGPRETLYDQVKPRMATVLGQDVPLLAQGKE